MARRNEHAPRKLTPSPLSALSRPTGLHAIPAASPLDLRLLSGARMKWLIVVAVVASSGCGQRNAWCLSSRDCVKPAVCMRETTDNIQSCQVPCGHGYPSCPEASSCSCPDSPAGKRCIPIDDSSRGPTPDDGGTFTGICFAVSSK